MSCNLPHQPANSDIQWFASWSEEIRESFNFHCELTPSSIPARGNDLRTISQDRYSKIHQSSTYTSQTTPLTTTTTNTTTTNNTTTERAEPHPTWCSSWPMSEGSVKWVNQERAVTRDKRHQIPGFHHTSSRFAPDAAGTHKIQQEAYRHMRLWQEEEELGLSRRKDINVEKSLPGSLFQLPTDNTEIKEQLIRSSTSFTKSKEEELDYNEEFNDPLYKVQWYLHNTGQLGHAGCDLNVTGAWRQGYTGRGVNISILDDGFQTTNADLAANYNPEVSYSVVHDGQPENDPSPRLDPPKYSNSHGTYCAGVVAAVANNGVCGVGVAYDAKVGGVRIVDGTVTDIQEATAMSRHVGEVAVFSASWGPRDDGIHVEGPGRLATLALRYGVMQGRGGLGTIYVWASGNGGLVADNCNLDGYASSIYTLTVSALTDLGESTFYSEPCASTLAGVYVGGHHTLSEAMAHNNLQTKVVVPELDAKDNLKAWSREDRSAVPVYTPVRVHIEHQVVDSVDKTIPRGWRAVGDASRTGHDSARGGAAEVHRGTIQRPLVVHEEPCVGVDAGTAHVFCGKSGGVVVV
ncbi:Neuroendocrine convertase 1 [Portunus trituberculatus]|uniref:Neuroendocrine convertase 1 n=1 Tax=Portunus trituberculatus TaxID=210409 RepID=A0A5B7DV90_PORTR|nr:Neuroendocrine convertase 1 [Portunus trituberculatus]